jgi:hypothetical protein
MVNKKFCLGILLMVLVFGITVIGCSDTQIVAFEYAKGPSEVKLGFLYMGNDIDGVGIHWNSVKNALSYDVYGQRSNDSDIVHFLTIQAEGFEREEHAYIFQSSEKGPNIDTSYYPYLLKYKWRFGVTVTDIDKNHVPSKIVWSDYITFPGYTGSNEDTPDTPEGHAGP